MPRRIQPGRRVTSLRHAHAVRVEALDIIARSIARGERRAYGHGRLFDHIAMGPARPISLCGRFLESATSEPGIRACPVCSKLWLKAMHTHESSGADEFAQTVTDELDNLIMTHRIAEFRSRWHDLRNAPELQEAVLTRLTARGVDVNEVVSA